MSAGGLRANPGPAGEVVSKRWQPADRQIRIVLMDASRIIALLREHEAELRAAGIERLAIFGSVARGEDSDASDVDIVVRLSPEATQGGFAYFGRLEALAGRLREILGRPVDVIPEPIRKERLRRSIEKESTLAF